MLHSSHTDDLLMKFRYYYSVDSIHAYIRRRCRFDQLNIMQFTKNENAKQ